MTKQFPTIGEYNQIIQKKGGNAFNSLSGIRLIPSRTTPIRVYLYGSGAYAAVFKGLLNGSTYAIRCFLSAENENINRYQAICNYLQNIPVKWKVDCSFLDNEISINGKSFPVLKMEWIDGKLINQFVTKNLDNNRVLSELQKQLVEVSNSLEDNKVGHGDLQCGNIIVQEKNGTDFQIKLIDYDGMYIPQFGISKSLENGRSEFQHPKRTINDFNYKIDRFSFWVMITALEAIKIDKTLWREIMQGGYNTLDNFLFTVRDFLNPNQSTLFSRLYSLNSKSLEFYLDKLKAFCFSDISYVDKPVLYGQTPIIESKDSRNITTNIQSEPSNLTAKKINKDKFKIVANDNSALILTSSFQRLGNPPLELDKSSYSGKTIIISNGKETKQITLSSSKDLIEIEFTK